MTADKLLLKHWGVLIFVRQELKQANTIRRQGIIAIWILHGIISIVLGCRERVERKGPALSPGRA